LEEIMRQNPNVKLDLDEEYGPALVDILRDNKGKIMKDGNINLRGIVIKGAPSLGTKFNPNFKDQHN
jgi:hypothetical protein